MKFSLGATTLSTLTSQTSSSSGDLGALVRRLAVAAEPLEGKFSGAGKQAFDAFKVDVDRVATDLNTSLGAILRGQSGMDNSFQTGDQSMNDNATKVSGAAPFDAARFAHH
jgi:uncharacterized protein YukE